jgi:Domain of unknown function (DUF4365)
MTDQHKTERLGVNAVEEAFLRMGWVFREQPIGDFGIDAHAEPTSDEGPTGRLIALQIKSGASYFRKRGSGFVYYGDARHLMYWKNHVLPVYIILHNPEKNLTVWQRVTDHLITHHDDGRWSIEIPCDQVLDEEAGQYLQRGVSADPSSIRRFRMAVDLPLIKEVEGRAQSDGVFLIVDEWVNKTLNFRETKMCFGDPDAEPKYEFLTWLPSSDLNEVMAHYFPWLDYQYEREIDDSSGEVESHTLSVERNELGKAVLAVEMYYQEGAEVGDLEPWYEYSNDSVAERFGEED